MFLCREAAQKTRQRKQEELARLRHMQQHLHSSVNNMGTTAMVIENLVRCPPFLLAALRAPFTVFAVTVA